MSGHSESDRHFMARLARVGPKVKRLTGSSTAVNTWEFISVKHFDRENESETPCVFFSLFVSFSVKAPSARGDLQVCV